MVIRIGPNDWAVQEEGQAISSKFLKKKGDIIVGHDYPGDYDDKDLEFLLDDFEPLDENFFKKFLRIPAFMRRQI